MPAKRKVFMHANHKPQIGEEWSIDSHMGGSFTVKYIGKGHWKIINKGWERTITPSISKLFRMEIR